jgi:hypothetical protein
MSFASIPGEVRLLARLQCIGRLHVGGRVALGEAVCDGITHDLAGVHQDPVGEVERAARLDLLHHHEQLGRGHGGDRQVADLGERVGLQSADHVVRVTLALRASPVLEPLAGHRLEGVHRPDHGRGLLGLARFARIDALNE